MYQISPDPEDMTLRGFFNVSQTDVQSLSSCCGHWKDIQEYLLTPPYNFNSKLSVTSEPKAYTALVSINVCPSNNHSKNIMITLHICSREKEFAFSSSSSILTNMTKTNLNSVFLHQV